MRTLLLSITLALLAPGPAAAQTTCAARRLSTVQIRTAPSFVAAAFPVPRASDFLRGWIDQPGLVLTVDPGSDTTHWDLCLSRGDLPEGTGELLARVAGGELWLPLTPFAQWAAGGMGRQVVTLDLRRRLAWATDGPGTYRAALRVSVIPR